VKRLQHFNSRFSILLAKCTRAAADRDDDSTAQWLTRLRHCLREVDLIGQLADALYVVILPHTKRRAAEAVCQRIAAELGPHSPLALSTVEITEPRHLAPILAGLNAPGDP
jgi:GGDEF domain-containing protein